MPIGGLSLLGFMDHQLALHYLTTYCIVADQSPQALLQHWNDARAKLGPAQPHAGQPNIQNIPVAHNAHLQQMLAAYPILAQPAPIPWSFRLVEIAPLLAFQFHIATELSVPRFAALPHPPQTGDMLPICLPLQPETCQPQITRSPNSIVFRDSNLNFRILGPLEDDPTQPFKVGGIALGPGNPWVAVSRFNGRCYLSNGYHRAYEVQAAGASHIPCMLLDVPDFAGVGAQGGGATFDRALLESGNPPTCGHFTDCLLYTSPSPRDLSTSRMPSSA